MNAKRGINAEYMGAHVRGLSLLTCTAPSSTETIAETRERERENKKPSSLICCDQNHSHRLRRSTMDVDPRQYEHLTVNDNDVNSVIMSYLVHNCFKETAESFVASTGMKQPSNYLEDMEKRKRIFHFALEGNALKAIELTEQLAGDLLEKNKDLHFNLLSLHFVELVCARKCTEALEFAQAKLTPFGKLQKDVEKLEDFMALLAYEEPEKSPMFHLLSMEYRQHVADSLNRAILAHANLPSYTAMERLIQQTTTVRQYLNEDLGKDGPPTFSLKDFLKS